jgi:hypothetical protein
MLMNKRKSASKMKGYKEQGLHPYHVQQVQVLQPNDYIRQQE